MEKLIVIRTVSEMNALSKYLEDKEFIAFDTETTGTEKDSQIIGFSVSAEVDVGYYVILSYWDVTSNQLIHLETKEASKSFLFKLTSKDNLIQHNAVFDCMMVNNNFDVDLMPHVHTDTMVLGHLLNENRSNGLKELGTAIYGENAAKEQREMKASVTSNGGVLTKEKYELYKAEPDLLAKYGAKDAILTLKLFYEFIPTLYEEGLDKFFYEDESMPLLRGPTYDLNSSGLRVDPVALQILKQTLEAECMEAKAYIYKEIEPFIKDKYPGTSKVKTFNIGAPQQMSWLLFSQLGNVFDFLTDGGRELARILGLKTYAVADKKNFIRTCVENKGVIYMKEQMDPKTHKIMRPKKVGDPWKYMSSDADTLEKFAGKYKWVAKLLEYYKNTKLLNTYVSGIQDRMKYNIIRPSFLQIGTTSGRYSSKNPNFQNLPREDKRIKACIVSRPGNVFVGADYAQLEPRVFASVSQDPTLMSCFERGEDFYSVVGMGIWGLQLKDCSPYKGVDNSFAKLHPDKRQISKAFSLATPYGTSAFRQSQELGLPKEECQDIIDKYFAAYPKVELMMLESHEQAKAAGAVRNLYGRPRRMPDAKDIEKVYGKGTPHGELPYEIRNILNLAMNHRVQSTAASIVNRAAIRCWENCKLMAIEDDRWRDVKIVLQVHDELVLEGPEDLAEDIAIVLKDAMENAITLPGVKLEAKPIIANNLADLK